MNRFIYFINKVYTKIKTLIGITQKNSKLAEACAWLSFLFLLFNRKSTVQN